LETSKIQNFLDELYIKYTLHTNVVSDSTFQFSAFANSINACAVKVILFSDKRGPALVVFPAKNGLDFEALEKVTNRNLTIDSGHKYKSQTRGFSIRNLPPFGRLFQMMMIVEERLQDHNSFLIDIGKGDSFIEVDRKGFDALISGSIKKRFSREIPPSGAYKENIDSGKQAQVVNMTNENKETETLLTDDVLQAVFRKSRDLPVMPEVGSQLIELKGQEDFDLIDLVHLIESDPMLSAKIIAYASSPFFAYQGRLESVQEAVYHVLGMDLSLNISLALAVGEQFKGPLRGPVGAMSIWRHSVYCAVLSQSIASKISHLTDVRPGTAYLHGLMHNIGFLVLGHMFSKKFNLFNKTIESKSDIPFNILEKNILGVTHTRAGSLLLDSWGLPNEYSIVVGSHHDIDYTGPHENYSHIVYISNCLLKSIGIGDASDEILPLELLKKYKLSETELNDMLQIVLQWNENIDHLAQQLVA